MVCFSTLLFISHFLFCRALRVGIDSFLADTFLLHSYLSNSVHRTSSALRRSLSSTGQIFCSVGVHPTRCKEFEESGNPEGHFQDLLSLAKEGIENVKVVAIGECGLDYDRLYFCPSEIQKKYFEKQFELAEAVQLPMFLYMRAAAEEFYHIVVRNKGRFTVELSIHLLVVPQSTINS